MTQPDRTYTLLGRDGVPYRSSEPGTLGGHRVSKIYGRLDCPAALLSLSRGGYVRHRVFFADEATAVAAGYRPCGACLPEDYLAWRARRDRAARSGSESGRVDDVGGRGTRRTLSR